MESIKKISVLLALVFLANMSFGQTWLTDVTKAKAKAKAEKKSILMVFAGSDWCRPCIQLKKKVLETPTFKQYAKDNLVLLYLDFPARKKNKLSKSQTAHNEKLAEKYNRSGAFPLVVLTNSKGKTLGKMGYDKKSTSKEYVAKLKKIAAKRSTASK